MGRDDYLIEQQKWRCELKGGVVDLLKTQSEKCGVKPLHIAKSIGVSKAAVSLWFNGKTYPSALAIPGLSRLLKLTPQQILYSIMKTNWIILLRNGLQNSGFLEARIIKELSIDADLLGSFIEGDKYPTPLLAARMADLLGIDKPLFLFCLELLQIDFNVPEISNGEANCSSFIVSDNSMIHEGINEGDVIYYIACDVGDIASGAKVVLNVDGNYVVRGCYVSGGRVLYVPSDVNHPVYDNNSTVVGIVTWVCKKV